MDNFANEVRTKASSTSSSAYWVSRCNRDGCSLDLTNVPVPFLLADLDHAQAPVKPQEPKCDYIFVGGCNWVAPIELTRGRPDASKFEAQLRAGAVIADRIIPRGKQIKFRPIAVYGGEGRRIEIDKLRRVQIRFRNLSSLVKLVKCSTSLSNALGN